MQKEILHREDGMREMEAAGHVKGGAGDLTNGSLFIGEGCFMKNLPTRGK